MGEDIMVLEMMHLAAAGTGERTESQPGGRAVNANCASIQSWRRNWERCGQRTVLFASAGPRHDPGAFDTQGRVPQPHHASAPRLGLSHAIPVLLLHHGVRRVPETLPACLRPGRCLAREGGRHPGRRQRHQKGLLLLTKTDTENV